MCFPSRHQATFKIYTQVRYTFKKYNTCDNITLSWCMNPYVLAAKSNTLLFYVRENCPICLSVAVTLFISANDDVQKIFSHKWNATWILTFAWNVPDITCPLLVNKNVRMKYKKIFIRTQNLYKNYNTLSWGCCNK